MNDFHWITPALSIGGRIPAGYHGRLHQEHGITHVVDLRLEARDSERELISHGLRLLRLPCWENGGEGSVDLEAMSQRSLWMGVEWVLAALKREASVLMHCDHGISRSALLSICVLVRLGHTPLSALNLLKSLTPKVSLRPTQLRALLEWSDEWHRRQAALPLA